MTAPPSPPPTDHLIPHSFRSLVTAPLLPIRWHWVGWVPARSVALLAGAGESAKSWLALYVGLCTAAGRKLFDQDEVQQGPVLYVAAETSLDEERRRVQLLRGGLDLPDEVPFHLVAADQLCLGEEAGYRELVRLVEEIEPVMLVLDSAIALAGLRQENDNAEVREFMRDRVLPLARRYGATVYLIAHSPKASQRQGSRLTDEHAAGGAGDWRNAADTVLWLQRDNQGVLVSHAKTRIGTRAVPFRFNLVDIEPDRSLWLVRDAEGVARKDIAQQQRELGDQNREACYDVVAAADQAMTGRQVTAVLNSRGVRIAERTTSRHLEALVQAGRLHCVAARGCATRYSRLASLREAA